MIPRIAASIVEERLFKGKAVLLYGARQTGKTTLVKDIIKKHGGVYFNADEPDIRLQLSNRTSSELGSLVGREKLVVIDEAQRIENIGLTPTPRRSDWTGRVRCPTLLQTGDRL